MLLGRDRELGMLRRMLDDARAGRSGVLALAGEAGIGKSVLIDAAAEAAAGMRVLRARGIQSEAQIPFAGLFELLRPVLGRLEQIPRPQAEALERALALRPARAEERFAVGAATLGLLAADAEEEPLAVLVDDAHWLDGASADALLFAVRRLVWDPIAVVVTVREGEPSLLDGADLPSLRLEGLDPEAAASLLRAAAGIGADAAARLHRETGGNPLALLELARDPPPEVPLDAPPPVVTSVAAAYLERTSVLSEETRHALLLAAAADRGELALVARAGSRLEVAVADLAPAEAAGLVSVAEGRIEFRHPLARSAIYGAAAAEERRRVHRALADELPDADRDRRAWHLALAAAGPDAAASAALEEAGRRAHERSAYGVASQALERAALLALDDGRRARLLAAAADAAWLGGLGERTISLLDDAAEPGAAAELDYLRGHVLLRRGPIGEGIAVLLAAAGRAEPPLAARLLGEALTGAFYAADGRAVRACAEGARALASADPQTLVLAALTEGMARVLLGERGATAIRDATTAFEGEAELRDDPRLLAWTAMGPLWLREAGVGQRVADEAVAAARDRAAVGVLPHLLLHVAIQQAATDRWVEAQASFDETIRLARETEQPVVLAGALARLAWLEARLGRGSACRAHAGEALALARRLGASLCEIWALFALGELEQASGDREAALARLLELEGVLARQAIADVDLSPAPELVELHLRAGRDGKAAAVAAGYAAAAEAKGQPWARARAARSLAVVTGDDVFPAVFEQALELHGRTPDGFERARTELSYGERLRRSGRRSAAREQLRAALDTFDELGATPWAERARVELAATGETARRRDPSTLDELTPQELQVALLLAAGKTTREAAAALFLSPKTIEYHLRNAYRKLAIHSRDELREALRSRPREAALARD